MGGLLRFAVCRVVCSVGQSTEFCLLILYELLFLVGTSTDLVAVEQRQGTKKGKLFFLLTMRA